MGVSNEGRRCIWPQAQGQKPADLTPHSYGGQEFEPESLICCYLTLTIQIPFLYLHCNFEFVLSAIAALTLKDVSDTASLKLYVLIEVWCALVVLIKKVEVAGEFRNITRNHGLISFVHEARQWLKASHPSPGGRYYFLLPLLLQSAKHLACSWELPSAIRPITSSALLGTDLMGPDHKIIVFT